MAVLIDSPAWPAHGTLFCHLVSDRSYEELHDLAERAGLPPRAFDRDHYDVPARLHDACVAAGALPTDSRTLAASLRRSGLRRPKARALAENRARRERLLARWPLPEAPQIAGDLLDRWSTRGRYYHDPRHLEECLNSLHTLGADDLLVTLAAWFHDAVYDGRPGADEEASALLAESQLDGLLPDEDRHEVARLVRTTTRHDPEPGDWRAELLSDADLAVLAAPTERYDEYRRDVRRDYADVPPDDFRAGRRAVVEQLAALQPLYRTTRGRELWELAARANLQRERRLLS